MVNKTHETFNNLIYVQINQLTTIMSKLYINSKYGIAPNVLLNDNKISLKAKGLYTFMQSKPNGWNFSISRISSQSKDGEDSVKSAVQELESAGFLTKKPSKDQNGKWNGFDYFLHESPLGEKPLAVKPPADKPLAENTPSLSKQDNSNKDIVIKNIEKKEEEVFTECEVVDPITDVASAPSHTPREINENFFKLLELPPEDILDEVKDIINWLRQKHGNEETVLEVNKFINYWCELTPGGKKKKWEQQPTFQIKNRFVTWFNNKKEKPTQKVGCGRKIIGL